LKLVQAYSKKYPTGFRAKISAMQIRFFVAPNTTTPYETIQADVIPPVGSSIKFPNRLMGVVSQIELDLPTPGLTLEVVDVVVQIQSH
jgi:hypothetical protein